MSFSILSFSNFFWIHSNILLIAPKHVSFLLWFVHWLLNFSFVVHFSGCQNVCSNGFFTKFK
jgi:hypothetical protein